MPLSKTQCHHMFRRWNRLNPQKLATLLEITHPKFTDFLILHVVALMKLKNQVNLENIASLKKHETLNAQKGRHFT